MKFSGLIYYFLCFPFLRKLCLFCQVSHLPYYPHTYLIFRISKENTKYYRLIGLVRKVFANGLGDLGSIPGRVIPKIKKRSLIPPCLTLSNIRYVSRVKWSNPGKGVASSPTSWCSSYWKGSLLVALDYGRQHLLLFYKDSCRRI